MLMYFQLLRGVHSENDVTYAAGEVRDNDSNVTERRQPVVSSEIDLVKAHGTDRFRRLSKQQATLLLADESVLGRATLAGTSPGTPASDNDVAKAMKTGAADVGAFASKDVTSQFGSARENGLRVLKIGDNYGVYDADTGDELTVGSPIPKESVSDFIKRYDTMRSPA